MKQILAWAKAHPRLTAWIVLGLGMNAIVVYEAWAVNLLPTQWVALVVATTLVAGLCVWIIGWEDDAPDDAANSAPKNTPPAPAPDKPSAQPAETKK
jgi:hypothetical protein